ncbi:MAG: GNAT family N-acetyltransferase [Gemmatimonadaceae bacterium]|nr:GNAT family N-acetyltransferase [Gemmatimonadaceae bacterium]
MADPARVLETRRTPSHTPSHTPSPLDGDVFPHHTDLIPPGTVDAGAYTLRFTWSRADLLAVQRLRAEVFVTTVGVTAQPAHGSHDPTTALDCDPRDPWFHHLMIVERSSGAVVGTYRLQTAVMAATRHGFYSATLFELGAIPASLLADAVEVGRAAVAARHRNGRVLRLLWQGLARYLTWNDKRHLFGCCSLPGTDRRIAEESWATLHAREAFDDQVRVRPRPEVRALADDGRTRPAADAPCCALPPLFDGYLSLGARVCSPPAVDRAFGTTDYVVWLDKEQLDPRTARHFFG